MKSAVTNGVAGETGDHALAALHPTFERVLAQVCHEFHEHTHVEWRVTKVSSSMGCSVYPYLGGEPYSGMPRDLWGEFITLAHRHQVYCCHMIEDEKMHLLYLGEG